MDYQLRWFTPGEQRYVKGYLHGRRQPAMHMQLTPSPQLIHFLQSGAAPELFANMQQWWLTHLQIDANKSRKVNDWPSLLLQLSDTTELLLTYLGYRILPHEDISECPAGAPNKAASSVLISLPHCSPQLVARAWSVVVMVAELHLRKQHDNAQSVPPEEWLMKVLTPLREPMRDGIHENFSSAAYEFDIPIAPLYGRLVQFGQGHLSQWLEHSFTQQTSVLPVRAARQKWYANQLLRRAGIPVPLQRAVKDQANAVELAQRISYPVVIKPADLDGGVGVSAYLSTQEEVIEAYQGARKHSENIIIEKHIEGKDYRIQVQDGRANFAVERIPAGVFGDGKHTIAELTAMENSHERRREGPTKNLVKLELDDITLKLLKAQQLTLDSVPAPGQFVRFRRLANLSAGGRPVPALEQAHPDNLALAVRAAQAMRLDNAGVDLIMPDITVSWRDSHAAICEVNANPDMGHTAGLLLYRNVLRNRIKGDGRIPIHVLINMSNNGSASQLRQKIVAQLGARYANVGWNEKGTVMINDTLLCNDASDMFHVFDVLSGNTDVEAMVLQFDEDSALTTGFPMDTITQLYAASETDQTTPLYQMAEKALDVALRATTG